MPIRDIKSITDPIHGIIRLSEVEWDILNTQTFQRLRHLYQLGLGHLVFPGATHTRFSHSLGVLHVVTAMLEALRRNNTNHHPIGESQEQEIRLAAMLHDIGHLPLSHALEPVIRRLDKEVKIKKNVRLADNQFFESTKKRNNSGVDKYLGLLDEMQSIHDEDNEAFSHERYSTQLIQHRTDLQAVFNKHSINHEMVSAMISKNGLAWSNPYAGLVSGTLDADRLDFVSRDSYFTGIKFGTAELRQLLENLNYGAIFDGLNDRKIVYVEHKGIPALEHFLTARYFQYHVSLNHTVMGLQHLAQVAYYFLARAKKVVHNGTKLEELIGQDEEFFMFNDSYFWQHLKEWKIVENDRTKKKILDRVRDCLLYRIAPVQLAEETDDLGTEGDKILSRTSVLKCVNSRKQFGGYKIGAEELFLTEHHIDFVKKGYVTVARGWKELRSSTGSAKKELARQFVAEAEQNGLVWVKHRGKVMPLVCMDHGPIQKLSGPTPKIRRLYWLCDKALDVAARTSVKSDFAKELSR